MPSKKDHTAPSGVYAIRHIASGKLYVGSAENIPVRWERHREDLSKGCHHSRHLQRAWDKYGADAFAFEVLRFVDGEQSLRRCEQEHLDDLQPWRHPLGYNISRDATAPMAGLTHTAEARAKMSAALKGKTRTPEQRAKIREANLRRTPEEIASIAAKRKITPELCAKISAALKGKPKSAEHREKMKTCINKGRKFPAEVRDKQSAARKGRKASEETKAKISAAARNPIPEARAKMSAANKDKVVSAETRAKLAAAYRNLPEETRARMAANREGTRLSAEHRAKISAAQKGKKRSPESIAKRTATIRASGKRRMHSPETRAKMSASHKGQTLSAETKAKISAAKCIRNADARLAKQAPPDGQLLLPFAG